MRVRKEYTINTLDVNKNRGIGISIPYNPVTVFNITYSTKEQVKSNLLNYLLTNKGERYFNPEFGADLRRLVFDQMTNQDQVKYELEEKIGLYFPNITLSEIEFTPNYDNLTLIISIKYTLNTQADSLVIQIS
jgi:phage baseplate assembly protein W